MFESSARMSKKINHYWLYCTMVFMLFHCIRFAQANHMVFENSYEAIDLCAVAIPEQHHSLFVSTNGSALGAGTQADPLDLATALSTNSPAQDGDTIWLQGGVYQGAFTSELRGREGSEITVRPMPGERVTIDSNGASSGTDGLRINGSWAIYRDLEVMSSDGGRVASESGSNPPDITLKGGVNVFGGHVKVINFVVHDSSGGISFWRPAVDSELYGNIIYNNGWTAPDRGHGHAIYTQNQTGTKLIENNIIFFGFGTGVHAYTEGGSIQGFDIVDNIWFQTGASDPRMSQRKDNCLVGGFQPVARLLLKNNQGWSKGRGTRVGYGGSVNNIDVTFVDNYLAEGLWFAGNWDSITMQNNVVYGDLINVNSASFPDNIFLPEHPLQGVKVFVSPNRYDLSRANMSIYNYSGADTVSADLNGFLNPGDGYEVRSVFDLWGPALVSGVFDGADVIVPMGRVAPPQPIGLVGGVAGDDDPGKSFGAFLIKRTTCSALIRSSKENLK